MNLAFAVCGSVRSSLTEKKMATRMKMLLTIPRARWINDKEQK